MPLTKTTTVPPGNADAVLALAILKVVVIVNDPTVAQSADDMAQLPPLIDRQAVWFPNGLPVAYQAILNVPNLGTAVAFSLSPTNLVKDVIRQGEAADDVRMDLAYTNAGL